MQSVRGFYESGLGDRLTNPFYYPTNIVDFRRHEKQIIIAIQSSFDLLIEVGCAGECYLDWAVAHKKRYIGMDIVERNVKIGQQRVINQGLSEDIYRFIVGDGENLTAIIHASELPVPVGRCLLLFPFNSFGNMQHPHKVLASLQSLKLPFLISSYQTTSNAIVYRQEYYQRCLYQDLHILFQQEGVCFTSSNGFYSMAYHPDYFYQLCQQHQLPITVTLARCFMNATYDVS